MFYVYLHCKPDGTPFYVGKGSGRRAYMFWRRSKYHKNIVKKYGKKNIIIEITDCADEEDALFHEQLFIFLLREDGVELCNYTDGGEGLSGYKHTEKTKLKIGKANKGNKYSVGNIPSKENRRATSLRSVGNKWSPRKQIDEVRVILMYQNGASQSACAREFKVSVTVIKRILRDFNITKHHPKNWSVHFYKGAYVAEVYINGKRKYLGRYSTLKIATGVVSRVKQGII